MEWVLRSPQIHNTFSDLGFAIPDGYHINDNCNSALETILQNLVTEDKYSRSYRRSISFGQNIKKDLIPVLMHTKDDKTIELLIKILVNLTIPVECLLSLETVSQTEIGRHAILEINNLLSSTKVAFTDNRVAKVVIDFLKKNAENEQKGKLSTECCTNISNTLLFLRNILHIPEDIDCHSPTYSGPPHTVQNQLLWNLFSQSIDKLLIKLMTIPDAINWGVTMVQFIALLYKDQHASTLHKLLNIWLEASLSESSEDNESNTSPPNRGNSDCSPVLTSEPTSDSSDTGASGKCNGEANFVDNNSWDDSSRNGKSDKQSFQSQNAENAPSGSTEGEHTKFTEDRKESNETENKNSKEVTTKTPEASQNNEKKNVISETSDCGYGTLIENQESMSTSSNEDELPSKKPIHKKPHKPKQKVNNKQRPSVTLQERRRKKIVKRGKANIINVQGLSHSTPTDDDISNVLKEFTVDFLLKGYNSLVRTLHSQILTNAQFEIDTSHFFWLVTYFLKFATQIELDLEHVGCVLSFEIASYLTAEGVHLCEQFELAIKLDGNDLKPSTRRLHLVVTAIREFIQAIEVYKKSAHICNNEREILDKLQIKMIETDELRLLLVLLLRCYNPKYQSKQYLQDLVVTNHILLLFMESVMKLPDYKGTVTMVDHLKQFCAPEMMYQYGLLLVDYESNGEFVNDCIFTLMHHVGGELDSLISLFQPKILKTFTIIWKSEFEVCDDWSDLIEYVINTFVKKPYKLQSSVQVHLDAALFGNDRRFKEMLGLAEHTDEEDEDLTPEVDLNSEINHSKGWSKDELSTLSWTYLQCNESPDVVGDIVKMFREDGIVKSRDSVLKELYNQFIINKEQLDKLSKKESEETRENEVGKLCEQLIQDGRSEFLDWVQTVIMETCAAKIYLEKKTSNTCHVQSVEEFLQKPEDFPVISSVSYHSLLRNQFVPLVPWNCQQASICKDLKFLQLLHHLGFHMPVDTGKVFIGIPHYWTPDILYEVAAKISPIDVSKLKFSMNDISQSSILRSDQTNILLLPELSKVLSPMADNLYQIHNKKQSHLASIVNFTPMSIIVEDADTMMKLVEAKEARPTPEAPLICVVEPVRLVSADAQQPAAFTIEQPESDCCDNSVCETASVASDLTRMYVSDEDDKPGPRRAAPAPPPDDACSHTSSEERYVTRKRPRIHFSPTF